MIDITEQDVFTALRLFLISFLPTTEVYQGQDNRVPMPQGINSFVIMNSTSLSRLSTNVDNYPNAIDATTKTIGVPNQYVIQCDFYGPDSSSWATQTQALFRDSYATDFMPQNIQPLFADDPVQIPLINGEEQYEQRWKLQVNIQYNPIITIGQDYANALNINLVEVDTTYAP